MPDREKVIGKLQFYVNICREDERSGEDLNGLILHPKYVEDAIALLKEMEPRVMTERELDECISSHDGEARVWIEHKRYGLYNASIWGGNPNRDDRNFYDVYRGCYYVRNEIGNWWRPWTARPTDEQRKAVEWNDQGGGHQNSGPV